MMKKRMLSVLLALSLCLGLLPAAALAEEIEDSKFHYLVIGDSTSNGFGFDEYYLNGKDVRGFDQVVPQAYPALIRDMLAADGKDVELHQFSGSALRPDDLDAILDPAHEDDDYTSRVFTGCNRGWGGGGEEWFKTWGHLLNHTVTDCATGEEVLRAEFYREIGRADLITYYLGSNSFGTFITGAITSGRYGDADTLQDLLAHLDISKELVNVQEIRAKLMGMLAQQFGEQVDLAALDAQFGTYIDLLVHGFVGAVAYFTKNIEAIRQLNPDCEIVVVGLHNYVDFAKGTYKGQFIDIGDYYGKLLELFNIYMGSLCERADDYYYADLAEAEIPVFFHELVSGEPSVTVQGYLDEWIGSLARGIVGSLPDGITNRQLSAMLRGWYENGFTHNETVNDYETLAVLAGAMGMLDADTQTALDGFGLDVPTALEMAYLYHTEDDAFVPMLYPLLERMRLNALQAAEEAGTPEEKAAAALAAVKYAAFQLVLKPPLPGDFISFKAFTLVLAMADYAGVAETLAPMLILLDGVGTQLDDIRSYGRVQELLLSCASTEPLQLDEVFDAFSGGGLDLDTIGKEIADVLAGEAEDLSPSTRSLINLYFMFMFPDGMGIGAHPNEEGHRIMAEVIYGAYKNQIVAKDYMDAKVLAVAAGLLDAFVESKGDVTVDSYSKISLKGKCVTTYTSLGDSTVFGYGLEDFAVTSDVFDKTYGYKASSQYAYPALLADYLGVKPENFHQLSMGSLRVEDVLSILIGAENGDGYYTDTILPLLREHAKGTTGVDQAHSDYVSSIKSSDLITIAVGGNNFTTFIGSQLDRLTAGQAPVTMDWSKYEGNEMTAIKAAIDEVFGMLEAFNVTAEAEMLKLLAESVIYEYMGALGCYAPMLDAIHALNPDATIVFIGLFNPADKVYYQKDGTTSRLELGRLLDVILSDINGVFRSYAEEHSDYCCFVSVEDAQVFIDTDDDAASWNLADGEYFPYITADHGVAGHPTEEGHAYMFGEILRALELQAPSSVRLTEKEGKICLDATVYETEQVVAASYDANDRLLKTEVFSAEQCGETLYLTPAENTAKVKAFILSGSFSPLNRSAVIKTSK